MTKEFLVKQQQTHDVEANWNKAINFIPLKAEIIIYDPDENFDYSRFKIGDGVTDVKNLPFAIGNIDFPSDSHINSLIDAKLALITNAEEVAF